MQHPVVAGRKIGEGKFGLRGTDELVLAADRPQESERRMIGGQEKMIAIVDGETQSRFEIGAAAAAGVTCKLVHDDLARRAGEPDCRGKTGKTGAHDMHRSASHHTMP